MDFSECPTDPPEGGGLDLGLFSKSNRPSRRGGLDIGLISQKERIQVEGGGGYKVTLVLQVVGKPGATWRP